MLTKTLAAAAALSMLVAGGEALAAQKKMSATVAGPKQPIPYSQLDAYLKASPKARASKDWWAGQASTGMSTDTSATTSNSSMSTTTDSAVNPSPSAAPPSMPMTPPTDAAPQPGDPSMSNQPAPSAPGASPVTPPTEPK